MKLTKIKKMNKVCRVKEFFFLITERIKKMILSNFENILDEMQMTLAMETLSECIGDVDKIRKNILPGQGTRKQRMQNFLRFILLYDHNVIVFEKMLKRNGLENILKMKQNAGGENITSENIGKPFKRY